MTVNQTLTPMKVLSESIFIDSTYFRVNDIRGYNKIDLVPGDFTSPCYGRFRNANGTVAELFQWDPDTITLGDKRIAGQGITLLKRGLAFNDLSTEVVGNMRDWSGENTYVDLDISVGPSGEMGEPGITWRGDYEESVTYAIGDAVSYQGSSYVAILETTWQPPTNGTYWDLLAQKGTAGDIPTLVAGVGIDVDSSDPSAPIISITQAVQDSLALADSAIQVETDPVFTASAAFSITAADLVKLGNTSGINTGDVTVSDSSEINFTLTGQDITASLVAGSIDEAKLDASVNASLDLADSAVQDLGDLGITATATELNYTDGVTSAIQTQLNGKEPTIGFTPENVANKSTSTSLGTSDTLYPTQNAVKTYADGLVAGLLDYRGGYDASGNVWPSTGGSGAAGAVVKGDMWVISVAGTLGGNAVAVGDSIIANVDTPGQTAANWNTLNTNITYVPEDVANKVTSISGSSTDTQYPSAKLVYDQLTLKLSLASLGTGVATALGVNVGTAGAFVVNGGALGTPSSGVATNLTGTAAGLTAGNVTTNANLTGDVTSVGNATTLATVNSNTGSFGSSTSIPTFTVNGKGLITAASGNAVVAPAGTLTGATLASGVTASSLTSLGTLTSATISGVLNLSGVNQMHQLSGHNFVQGDSTNTYLYGGTSGLHFRSTDNSTALIDISNTGNLTFSTDNTQDIGASGATRPRTGYFGTSVVINGATALVNGGALGTPSSGVATNLTGTASGLTAGTVTTNANLTGVVTSTGNATAIADAALSIAKTSGLQTALDAKAPLTSPTFATSITGSYLTASEMLITDASKNIVSAPVATYPSLTELTYLKGVTSAIQTQLNAKGSGTVTSVAALTLGTTGTDLSSSVANGTTAPVITLNVPTASASNRGALSSTDWSTFNGKQSAITFGTGVQTALGVNIGSAGAPVLFNGAGGTPSSLVGTNISGTAASLTAGAATVLSTPRAIYGNNFDGSAALTQVIASTYGGTGNGFTKFSGPTTSEKTFTLPNSSATLLYSGGALGTPSSGTGTNITGIPAANILAGSLGTGNFTVTGQLNVTTVINANTSGTVTSGFATGMTMGSWDMFGYPSTGSNMVIGGYRSSQWDAIRFYASASEKMRVTTTGLGIGETAPAAALHVNSGGTSLQSIFNSTNADGGYQRFDKSGTTYGYIGNQDALTSLGGTGLALRSTGSIQMTTNGGTVRVVIDTAGGVRFNNYGAGTITSDASGNLTSVSDERLKDIKGGVTSGLKELLNINPIVYKWNEKSGLETEHEYAGFSAQNVKENIPLGTGVTSEGYLTLQDRAILATVVNAVKELERRVSNPQVI